MSTEAEVKSSQESAQLSHYLVFAKIMCENLSFVKTLSQCIDQAEYDSFASALVNISVKAGRTLPLINAVVASEFERNFRTPGSIMRGNCVASKLMGAYSRKLCGQYLQECIGDLVTDIVMDESLSLEIDPRKCKDADSAKKNVSLLKKKATAFVERITSDAMLAIVPREIRAISGFTADYARTYASDRLIPLIGGFFMLRLYNPCLVTPESSGLLPKGVKPSPSARRNLTLITKLLQNLSNGILFGSKEPYMTPMNPFIESQQKKMNEFLLKLSTDPEATEGRAPWVDCLTSPTKELTADGLEMKDLELIHSLIYNYKGKLLEMLQEEIEKSTDKDWSEEELLFATLDKLGLPRSTTQRKSRVEIESIQFLRPPEKSGHVTKKKDKTKKRYWLVLTDKFLHFFDNAQDTRPRKSIPLDDITIAVAEIGTDAECYFPLGYNRRTHLFYCTDAQMVEDWTRALCTGKLRQARHRAPEINKKLSALEQRIQNHRMGRKLEYQFTFASFHAHDNGRVSFEFSVQAFGAKFTVSKSFGQLLDLHMELTKQFPRIIFPSFPVNIGEWPPSKEELRYRTVYHSVQGPVEATATPKSSDAKEKPAKGSKIMRDNKKKARFASTRAGASTPPKLMLSHFQGHPSFAVLIMCKFLRAYVEDVSNNLQVSQSDPVLRFIGVLSAFRAVRDDCSEQLNYLLKKACEEKRNLFEECDEFGETPLHHAAIKGRVDLIKWMLENGADVGVRAKDQSTALHRALEYAHEDAATYLLEMQSPVDVENAKKETALHVAATHGMMEVCQILLQCGAQVGAYDNKGRPPIQRAIRYNHPKIAQMFIEHGANTSYRDTYGNTLIHLATAGGMTDIISSLLSDRRVNINAQGRYRATALHIAAKIGSGTLVKQLMSSGADPKVVDIEGCTPLHVGALEGHMKVLDHLIPVSDVDCKNNQGRTPIHMAVIGSSPQCVRALAQAKADVNVKDNVGATALHLAVDVDADCVHELLIHDAKPDIPDNRSMSPLHLSVLLSRQEAMQLLFNSGASAAHTTAEGDTPLHIASWTKSLEATKLICHHGGSPNSQDDRGSTPLHIAVRMNETPLVKYLCRQADLNVQQFDGNSALHVAAENDYTNTAVMLIEHGIKLNLQNADEETALHIAVRRCNDTLAVYLAEHGANPNLTNKHNVSAITEAKGKLKAQLTEAYQKAKESSTPLSVSTISPVTPADEHNIKFWIVEQGERSRSMTVNLRAYTSASELLKQVTGTLGVEQNACAFSYDSLDSEEVPIAESTSIEELMNEATHCSVTLQLQ
eukprot:TRINITY_DN12389_c0_g1_i2.p1 TRINITY_DN12389_c0_g1~~TRINITY_DN12389_c0_g1_i2.p1  ORF type:complete len:1292 (+),score=422.53 TRINITY_DN12389_c0_g1_i2:31-3906(+)